MAHQEPPGSPPGQTAPTRRQAILAAKQLFGTDTAGVMLVDVDGILRWASTSDQRALT